MVIVNTNTGYSVLPLAARLAEAMTGEPLPFDMPGRGGEAEEGPPGAGAGAGAGAGGQVPDSPRYRTGMTFLTAVRDGSPEALRSLVVEHFSPAMQDAFSMEEHLEELGRLGERVRASGDIRLAPRGPYTVEIHFKHEREAYRAEWYPGAKRTGDWSVACTCDDFLDAMRFFMLAR